MDESRTHIDILVVTMATATTMRMSMSSVQLPSHTEWIIGPKIWRKTHKKTSFKSMQRKSMRRNFEERWWNVIKSVACERMKNGGRHGNQHDEIKPFKHLTIYVSLSLTVCLRSLWSSNKLCLIICIFYPSTVKNRTEREARRRWNLAMVLLAISQFVVGLKLRLWFLIFFSLPSPSSSVSRSYDSLDSPAPMCK